MIYTYLKNNWYLNYQEKKLSTEIPTSLYNTLLTHNMIDDPFYRDNELKYLPLNNEDYIFETKFKYSPTKNKVELNFLGIDTISEIILNDIKLGTTNNMHREWKFDVTSYLKEENHLVVKIFSPVNFIKEMDEKDHVGGSVHAMKGFPHLRKAHCMFGWDWGPRIPDLGIWRNVFLKEYDTHFIKDVYFKQKLIDNFVDVSVDVEATTENYKITLTSPNNEIIDINNTGITKIKNPMLWFPNGLGTPHLYLLKVELFEKGVVVDTYERKIGLRELTVVRKKDEFGESFAHSINGLEFFGMGADWIPQDNLLPRITKENTEMILKDCALANFNCIRVWGGGYYPEDYFFDICDELGLVVWQDFMFSCANYRLTEEFEENIWSEFEDNIKRIRHHASLGLWCGNNEMEMFQLVGDYDGDDSTRADYIKMFEYLIPKALKKYDPNTYYWPASPSSGGSFYKPNDENMGDCHYWAVWHREKPFKDFRNYHFRYLSEFGFQSFPMLDTIKSFTLEEDRNVFSRVMEMHQRNDSANGRILKYLSQTYLYPNSFESLIYASHLLQAEAIKYGVEHFRRYRGRCMGTIFWQLNDIWPTASWASIDYSGRWKALQYYAKRFFAPVTVSFEEVSELTSRVSIVSEPSKVNIGGKFCVKNETLEDVNTVLNYSICNNKGEVLERNSIEVKVEKLSVKWLEYLDFSNYDFKNTYLKYDLTMKDKVISKDTVLFTAPKHFEFEKPQFDIEVMDNKIRIGTNTFAKNVYIFADDSDLLLSDNYFDINNENVSVEVLRGNPQNIKVMSVYDIR
ncbi:MAG: beta-mannosidase [Anaerocolumna sp.]